MHESAKFVVFSVCVGIASAMMFTSGYVAGVAKREPVPVNVSVDSMDEIKLNHLIRIINSIDMQNDALVQDIESIKVELVKIRKEM